MSHARIFQCPTCHEFIATDAKSCRFCSTPIDPQTAQLAADSQAVENRTYRRKQYARHMFIGAGLLSAGSILTLLTIGLAAYSEHEGHVLITYGLILSGLGEFLYGFVGWLGELKK